MNPPFFIIGSPRSGTSLFRIMLDSHPNIVVPPECGLIEWFYEKYKNWHIGCDINIFVEDLMSARKFETWKLEKEEILTHLNLSKPDSYQELCFRIYEVFALKNNKKTTFWGDKNNYYIYRLDKLNEIFPMAKYIHIIRDGRDVATSYLEINNIKSESNYKPVLPNRIDEIAKEWLENNQTIEKFTKNLPKSDTLVIYYEDLIKNTKATLEYVCRFLGVPYHTLMLEYSVLNRKQEKEPKELLAWKKRTLKKPDITRIGKYHNQLSKLQIKEFEDIARNVLKKYNYI